MNALAVLLSGNMKLANKLNPNAVNKSATAFCLNVETSLLGTERFGRVVFLWWCGPLESKSGVLMTIPWSFKFDKEMLLSTAKLSPLK